MDIIVVNHLLNRYPALVNFVDAGTISLKMAREILDVDRYLMFDIFKQLVLARAVTSCGTTCWRATKELKDFLKERRKNDKSIDTSKNFV